MSSLVGKLEGEVKIKSSAEKFYDIISRKPIKVSKILREKIKNYVLRYEGELGKAASSLLVWYYYLDGQDKLVKIQIEDANTDINSIAYKVIEGDEFKDVKFIIKVTPMIEGGSMVQWASEYEKLNETCPEPKALLKFVLGLSKDIDEHLQVEAAGTRDLHVDLELGVMTSAEIDLDISALL